LEKDLEKLSTHDELREKNKKLKLEKEHLKTGLSKFTIGQYLQSELLINTVMKMIEVILDSWQIKRRKLKLNINNNTCQILSQRDALSVDKKVTLLMSVKLHHHNPCPSMLDPFLSMLTTCLEMILVKR
jgi:hypothetical protein